METLHTIELSCLVLNVAVCNQIYGWCWLLNEFIIYQGNSLVNVDIWLGWIKDWKQLYLPPLGRLFIVSWFN